VQNDMQLIDLAARQHYLIARGDARRLGVMPHVWRRWEEEGRWIQLTPTHYRHAATPLTFRMQVAAGTEWIGRRGALFGASALAWLGLLTAQPLRAEFLVQRRRRSIPNWMTLHTTTRWDNGDVISRDGVRTCTATRAIIDWATQRPSASELEAVIDRAIALRMTALPKLRRRLSDLSGRGRAGSTLLRELLLDSGGESYLERRFLRLVRTAGFPRPTPQVIFKRGTERVARVDFHFPRHHVVVEVSGRLGHVSDRDRQRDARRRNALQQLGETVLEFTTVDVIDGVDYVLRTLRTSLNVAD
jgi:hypothetical protein